MKKREIKQLLKLMGKYGITPGDLPFMPPQKDVNWRKLIQTVGEAKQNRKEVENG